MPKISKEYRLKCIELAEAAIQELDKCESLDDKRALVNWVSNFWGHATQDLASYSIARPDIKELALRGITNRFAKAKEVL